MTVSYKVQRLIDSARHHVEDAISDLREIVDLPRSGFEDPEKILRDLEEAERRLRNF